ncbi:UNVERIFIED_CONTAM: DNA-binding XRE family transcriptional regulator [Acetivibrio alkalicellulosi]
MISKRLYQLREEKNLKQSELAEAIGISRISISNYENGERVPDAKVIFKLSKFLDVSSDYILGLSNIKKHDCLTALTKSIINHHEYSINIEHIFKNLDLLLKVSDEECEKIDQDDTKLKAIELLRIIGDVKYAIHQAKENLANVKNKIIDDLNFIENNTLEYIKTKLLEYEKEYLKEVESTLGE